MREILTKIRGADIKEIEIFMLLVTVWVLVLFGAAFIFPAISTDSTIINLLSIYPSLSIIIFWSACLVTILGIFTYLGKYVNFIAPWLLFSGIFWGGMSLLMLVFQPFTIIFGVCAFLTTTAFHLFTLHVKDRTLMVQRRHNTYLRKSG